MAKKSKDDAPNPHSVANRDILQRMNFLYQASAYLGSVQGPPAAFDGRTGLTGQARRDEARRRNRARHATAPADLARAYVRSMQAIGQKTTVRMDPSVKRTLCRTCNLVLIPGRTELVRVNPWPGTGHAVCYTCMSCQTTRRIPAPPVLDEDAAGEVPEGEAGASHAAEDAPTEMDVDPPPTEPGPAQPKRKRGPRPRLPPLFERNVGHVVFRGNERIA